MRRGAIPAVVAPGRKTADDAKPCGEWIDAASAVSPSMMASCWRGIQMSGGSLPRVSPKNPGGAMPMMVKGWPWTANVEPRMEVSPA